MTKPPRLPDDLVGWLVEHYESAWLAYPPAVMAHVLHEDGALPDIAEDSSTGLLDQIQALRTLLTTDAARFDPVAFEKIVHGLCGASIDPRTIHGCTPGQLVFAFKHCAALRKVKFEEHIRAYIAACLDFYGFAAYPPELAFAEHEGTAEQADLRKRVHAAPPFDVEQPGDVYDPLTAQRYKLATAIATAEAIAHELTI